MDLENPTIHLNSPLIILPPSKNALGFDLSEASVELKKQLELAWPLVVVSILQYSLQLISVMFVGHLGGLSLSSASMASCFASMTGLSFMMGMGSALETFCGQAYGAKQYHMLGIHMQRAMLVIMFMGVPIALLWANTGFIFTYFGQDLEISIKAGKYARYLIPGIFPYGILQCQLRFLQTQNIIKPLMLSTSFTSLFHVLCCWTLVFGLGFGDCGAALSNSISYWINVVILAIYIKISPQCKQTWTGFSKEGTKNLFEFMSLGFPSALMVCLEYWSYEILVLMAGILPNPKLETSMMSISLSTISLAFRVPFGLGSAVSTRVSNELGAGRPCAAQLAVRVVIFLAMTEVLLVSFGLLATRNVWGYTYTNDIEVVKYMVLVIPVLALSICMDGIQGVLSGTARGCGWQKTGALVNLGAYYLVGLPSAIILTFLFNFGGKGLWMGIIGGSGLQALLLFAITMRTNWEQEAKKARIKVYNCSIPTDMVS